MSERLITDQREFDELCSHIREAGLVAFDTEFISENTYRPKLCLIQLATRERAVAVDPFEVDVSDWWNIMTDDQTTVVVHAGREESRFCLTFTGERPRLLVDVQLAEGLRQHNTARMLFDPAANIIFFDMPRRDHQRMLAAGAVYYVMSGDPDHGDPDEMLTARLVTDWSMTADGVSRFLDLLHG